MSFDYHRHEQKKFQNRLHKIMSRADIVDDLDTKANEAAWIAEFGCDDPLEIRQDEKEFGCEPCGHYSHLLWMKGMGIDIKGKNDV